MIPDRASIAAGLVCLVMLSSSSATAQDVVDDSTPAAAPTTAPPTTAAPTATTTEQTPTTAPPPTAQPTTTTTAPPNDHDTAAVLRTPIQAMNEHFLGTASRAVRFDWRRSPVTFGLDISEVVERNTFGQWRVGALGRKAFDDLIVEVGVHLYQAYDTPSSQTLALTPFRQAGRPNHLEVDVNVGYAVAEGVVTPLASFIPPAELALVAVGGVRYLGYGQTFFDRKLQDIGLALVSPQLSTSEIDQIEATAPGAMLVDPARLHTVAGLALDVYFQPGFYFSPRALVTVPVLVPVTASQLGFFWELSFVAGYAL